MLLKLKKIFSCSTSHRLLYWVSTAKHFMVFQVLVWQKNSEQTYFYDNEITKVQPVMIFMNQVLTCFVDIHIYGIENIFRKILWCFSKINIFLCYLAALQPTFRHSWRDRLSHPILIIVFVKCFKPKFTGTHVMRLALYAWPNIFWDLHWAPFVSISMP